MNSTDSVQCMRSENRTIRYSVGSLCVGGTFERSSCGVWTGKIFCQIVNCKMTTRLSFQFFNDSQQKCGKGLDEIHPFSDTTAVDVLLRETDQLFSPDCDIIGYNNAGRIWSIVSKFMMLDQFAKALELTKVYPNLLLRKETFSSNYIGTASKVGIFLTFLHILRGFRC